MPLDIAGATVFVGGIVAATGVQGEVVTGGALIAIVAGIAAAVVNARTRARLEDAYGQIKAAQDTADLAHAASESWKSEYQAGVVRAERLARDLLAETAARNAAEARTDITRLEEQTAENQAAVIHMLGSIQQVLEVIAEHTDIIPEPRALAPSGAS